MLLYHVTYYLINHAEESTIAAIKTKPGTGEYDLVLEAARRTVEP